MKFFQVALSLASLTAVAQACAEIHCTSYTQALDPTQITAQVYDNGVKVCNVAGAYEHGEDTNNVKTFTGVAGGCISDDYEVTITGKQCEHYTYENKAASYKTEFAPNPRTYDYTEKRCVCEDIDFQGNCARPYDCITHEVCARDGYGDCDGGECRLCDGKADCDGNP